MNPNPTPRWVRRAVILCVAMPAGLVRIFSSLYACVAWGLIGTGLGLHPQLTGLPMFVATVVVSVLAYLVVVAVEFFAAEQGYSVGLKRIAANIALELTVQLLMIASLCLLISGVEASSPPLGFAGFLVGTASVIINFCSRGRIKAWKEAWNPGCTKS